LTDPTYIDSFSHHDSYFSDFSNPSEVKVFYQALLDGTPVFVPPHYSSLQYKCADSEELECYTCIGFKRIVEIAMVLRYLPSQMVTKLSLHHDSLHEKWDSILAELKLDGWTFDHRNLARRAFLDVIILRLLYGKKLDTALDLLHSFCGLPSFNKIRFQVSEG